MPEMRLPKGTCGNREDTKRMNRRAGTGNKEKAEKPHYSFLNLIQNCSVFIWIQSTCQWSHSKKEHLTKHLSNHILRHRERPYPDSPGEETEEFRSAGTEIGFWSRHQRGRANRAQQITGAGKTGERRQYPALPTVPGVPEKNFHTGAGRNYRG